MAVAAMLSAAATKPAKADSAAPITIAYSDWPGWTCWDIAQKEGLFAKHHCNVKLVWFPNYSDSLNALAAGQVDANCQTWSDTMGPLAAGVPLSVVLINDNSAGNDAIIARAGITSVKQLRGLKVATELGTCDQFLLDEALNRNGMSEADIQYVNIAVQDCPAAMVAGKIDACVVWEPNKSQLLSQLKGTHDIYDSRSIPGLIPDLLVFQKKVVQEHPQAIQNIVDAWYDMMEWWRAHPDQAVTIMAARTDSPVSFYKGFIKGTRLFDATEAVHAFKNSPKMTSLYTSGSAICGFLLNVKPPQIDTTPNYAATLDPQFVDAAAAKGEGKYPPLDYGFPVD
jgi:NitT/TauT family transport system substrate-binding protein